MAARIFATTVIDLRLELRFEVEPCGVIVFIAVLAFKWNRNRAGIFQDIGQGRQIAHFLPGVGQDRSL